MAGAKTQVRPSIGLLLDRAGDALDGLKAEVSLGIRNQRHFDDLETRASAIGDELRAAFRKGRRDQ
jgi:hypothetical protein